MRIQNAIALSAVGLFVAALLTPHAARADEVMSPYVEQYEWELENEGIATIHDKNSDMKGAKDIEMDLGYSPTSWWKIEAETEFEQDGGADAENIHYSSLNFLNTFQLAETGEYWIDPGLFYEMDFAPAHQANNIIFGVIGAKQIGNTLTTVNLFGHKEFGPNPDPLAGFAYSMQSKYLWLQSLQPGFEVFGDTDGQSQFKLQQLAAGPGIFGKFNLAPGKDLRYEATYLFGATPASPAQAVRWKLEYEFHF